MAKPRAKEAVPASAAAATQGTPGSRGVGEIPVVEPLGPNGTTATLFPNTAQPEPASVPQEPEPTPEPKAEPEVKTEENAPEVQPETASQELDLDDLFQKYGERKKKVVVDGKVVEVPLAEIVRDYQTGKTLAERGRQVGAERKALAEERRQIEELRRSIQSPRPDSVDQPQDEPSRELLALKAQIAALQSTLAPAVYQSARQKLNDELKAEGFDDFLEYVPKMDAYVGAVQDERQFHYYNTPEGAKALYLEMKLKDLKNSKPQALPTPPVPEKKLPPIVRIDSGSPAGGKVDDWTAKYEAALNRFKDNPKDLAAYRDVMRLKGVVGHKT